MHVRHESLFAAGDRQGSHNATDIDIQTYRPRNSGYRKKGYRKEQWISNKVEIYSRIAMVLVIKLIAYA